MSRITLFEHLSLVLVFNENSGMKQNQTNHTFKVDDHFMPLNIWQEWKSDLSILFSGIWAVVIGSGQGMIIHYIRRHAPKERPINRLFLIDQVCKTDAFNSLNPHVFIHSTEPSSEGLGHCTGLLYVLCTPTHNIFLPLPCSLQSLELTYYCGCVVGIELA